MARVVSIPGSVHTVKVRNPWAVALLPFITFGIYGIVWWYRINKELKLYGEARGYDLGRNPTNSLVAIFPGFILIIPPIISYWRGTQRVMGAARVAGRPPANGWIALILYIVISPAYCGYLQSSLNSVWLAEADSAYGRGPEIIGGTTPNALPRGT